ncbi:MAG TPA: DUF4340 domain-containing protein [Candidatus Acidoferrales bacterium]|nr:DUF4340 domain-containing protein [Candidatus Acidoferrales bacterium]
MKKSTLIVVVIAIALGCFVYFYDSKHTAKTSAKETLKPAFTVKPSDVASITIQRKDNTVVLDKKGGTWELTKPVEAEADQGTIGGIASDLSDLKIQRSFVATDDLSKYGLANPAATIEFQDAKGAQHTIQLGDKDFSGDAVYALVDKANPPKIDLLAVSLLDDTSKPVNDLRDRSLIDLNGAEVTALSIDDPNGAIKLTKAPAGWEITEPRTTAADSEAVDGLVSSLSTGKFTDVASESAKDLGKYGLARPEIKLDATAKNGKQFHLVLGKKGTEYYGRDLERPMVFTVNSTVYDSFDKKFFDLRDKEILHFDAKDVATVEVKNAKGSIKCAQGKIDEWKMVQPASDKGKSVEGWKLTDPIENARAKQIWDKPPAGVLAHLKKPAIQVVLTDKSGKTTTIQISGAVGDSVYVRTSAGSQVYELGTQILKDLGFKASDLFI